MVEICHDYDFSIRFLGLRLGLLDYVYCLEDQLKSHPLSPTLE